MRRRPGCSRAGRALFHASGIACLNISLSDHPPVSVFLDHQVQLISSSPTEPYPPRPWNNLPSEFRKCSFSPLSLTITHHHLRHDPLSIAFGFALRTKVTPLEGLLSRFTRSFTFQLSIFKQHLP